MFPPSRTKDERHRDRTHRDRGVECYGGARITDGVQPPFYHMRRKDGDGGGFRQKESVRREMRELNRRSAIDWPDLARANLVTIEATYLPRPASRSLGHGSQASHAVACSMRISPSVAPSG